MGPHSDGWACRARRPGAGSSDPGVVSGQRRERRPVSGRYLYHKGRTRPTPQASDIGVQNGFLKACEELTGVKLA